MWEISISEIFCEINPKNRKVSLWTPKITIPKSDCRAHCCVELAKINLMMAKITNSELICGRYGLLKIMDR
jgi:DNA gyrase inhibitor GyrI